MGVDDRSEFRDLIGPHEIEVLLEMSASEVAELLSGGDFPAPVLERGKRRELRLWHQDDVVAWWSRQSGTSERGLLGDVIAASREAIASEAVVGDPDELMTAKEVAELLDWKSPSTPWDLAKRGTFPEPTRSHGRTKLWARGEVERWRGMTPRRRRGGDNPASDQLGSNR